MKPSFSFQINIHEWCATDGGTVLAIAHSPDHPTRRVFNSFAHLSTEHIAPAIILDRRPDDDAPRSMARTPNGPMHRSTAQSPVVYIHRSPARHLERRGHCSLAQPLGHPFLWNSYASSEHVLNQGTQMLGPFYAWLCISLRFWRNQPRGKYWIERSSGLHSLVLSASYLQPFYSHPPRLAPWTSLNSQTRVDFSPTRTWLCSSTAQLLCWEIFSCGSPPNHLQLNSASHPLNNSVIPRNILHSVRVFYVVITRKTCQSKRRPQMSMVLFRRTRAPNPPTIIVRSAL